MEIAQKDRKNSRKIVKSIKVAVGREGERNMYLEDFELPAEIERLEGNNALEKIAAF